MGGSNARRNSSMMIIKMMNLPPSEKELLLKDVLVYREDQAVNQDDRDEGFDDNNSSINKNIHLVADVAVMAKDFSLMEQIIIEGVSVEWSEVVAQCIEKKLKQMHGDRDC